MSTFTVTDLVAMPRVSATVASPDGTWFAVEVHSLDEAGAKYVPQLFRVTSGGNPEPMLKGAYGSKSPCFRQDGALGFLSNRDPDAAADEAPR